MDINLPYVDYGYRVTFFGDEIEEIESMEIQTGKRIAQMENAAIFPANLYLAPKDMMQQICTRYRTKWAPKWIILKVHRQIHRGAASERTREL